MLKCFKDYEKFKITKDECEECQCAKIKVNYSPKESPFPSFANQRIGCVYCDSNLKDLVEWPERFNPDS